MASSKVADVTAKVKSSLRFDTLFLEYYPDRPVQNHMTLCPWHGDTTPSLKLTQKAGLCFGSCGDGKKPRSYDIFDLHILRYGADFKAARDALSARCGLVSHRSEGRGDKGKIAALYDYTDEAGTVLYQVARFKPKSFLQRRPDPEKAGSWIWNLRGIDPVLFRLPQLRDAHQIWIPEGEKDVLALEALGLTATCNPMGAGKWSKVSRDGKPPDALRGKDVLIVPDNDSPGRQHARDIAQSLHGFAASVKIVTLPDVREKGDVSDYIRMHGPEKAQWTLLQLAKDTSEYDPTSDSTEAAESAGESADDKRPSKFKILVGLLEKIDVQFFPDQFGSPWACLQISDHHENVRIKSSRFVTFLIKLFYDATGEGCGRETIKQVQDLCAARALFGGQTRPLSYRSAWQRDRILIDLGTDDWSALDVSADGWKIVTPQCPPFRRFAHMQPLPRPEPGGHVQDILSVLPITEEDSKILVCIWLASILIPDIPRPGIVLAGLQGAGKTFATETLRTLVDPSRTLTLSMSKDATEMIQLLDHHYLPCFDNIDGLPRWASDVLCRAVTGAGFSKRELFSDDDDFSYSFHRPFVLNGISVSASRPDLLDRSLIVELDRITGDRRRSRKKLLDDLARLQPKILHAILDALVTAMARKPDVNLEELPRLADWAEWAVCLAESIGISMDVFLGALERNTQRQHSEVNNSEPTAVAVIDFMSTHLEWRGTPSQLYDELSTVAEELKLTREKAWPKAPNSLSRKLKAVSHNLLAAGIEIRDDREGKKGTRKFVISRVTPPPTDNPDKSSASSDRPPSRDSNGLSTDDTADDITTAGSSNVVSNTDSRNSPEPLPTDDTDRIDDISGNCVGPESDRLHEWGCATCHWFTHHENLITCHFPDEPADLTAEDFRCPRFGEDGKPLSQEDLPFALTEPL